MKWQIQTYYKKHFNDNYLGQIDYIYSQLRTYLKKRDYTIVYQSDVITDSLGCTFDLNFEINNNILIITVSSSNWKSSSNTLYPQLVLLVADYFKINGHLWYYLETLNTYEINQIDEFGRSIDPFKIKQRIDTIEINPNISKPIIERIGDYDYLQIDLYSGSKDKHIDLIGFWVSFLIWVCHAKMIYSDLSYFTEKGWFDSFYGACIPMSIDELSHEPAQIKKEIDWFNEEDIKEIYLMRNDWNNHVHLFDMGDTFIIYTYWTVE